jgi:hypothetical protein
MWQSNDPEKVLEGLDEAFEFADWDSNKLPDEMQLGCVPATLFKLGILKFSGLRAVVFTPTSSPSAFATAKKGVIRLQTLITVPVRDLNYYFS